MGLINTGTTISINPSAIFPTLDCRDPIQITFLAELWGGEALISPTIAGGSKEECLSTALPAGVTSNTQPGIHDVWRKR